MPGYVTVFQISSGTSGLPFALAGLVPLTIGLILILGKWRLHWRGPGWLFAGSWCAFGIMWLFLATGPVLSEGHDAFTAFRDGRYSVVEGVVEDFHPMPYEGHQDECFTVASQQFCYSDYEITPGFHNAASHGGPIRAGIHVRVSHFGGAILRLEILRSDLLSPAESAANSELEERQYTNRTNHDPLLQRMNTSFLFTTFCWVLWWNLQWRKAMRFWIKRPTTIKVRLIRIFFAVSLIGSVKSVIDQIRLQSLTRESIGPVLLTTAIMCAVVAAMTAFSLWFSSRRERQLSDTQSANGPKDAAQP